MNQCTNPIVAFGLNGLEVSILLFFAIVGLSFYLVHYLNKGIGEDRRERK